MSLVQFFFFKQRTHPKAFKIFYLQEFQMLSALLRKHCHWSYEVLTSALTVLGGASAMPVTFHPAAQAVLG
jgi:hypothetical protein